MQISELVALGDIFPLINNPTRENVGIIIRKYVKPVSTIYSDGWSAYLTLNKEGYNHFIVCHTSSFKQEYKNLETGMTINCNTNTIEGGWALLKQHFKKKNMVVQFQPLKDTLQR